MSSTLRTFGSLSELPSTGRLTTHHRNSVVNVKRRDLDLVLVRVLETLAMEVILCLAIIAGDAGLAGAHT